MTITTTTPYRITPGMTILKRISDGHYYGDVSRVERVTDRGVDYRDDFRVTFADGESIVYRSGTPVMVKA